MGFLSGVLGSVVGGLFSNNAADKAHDNYMAARANQHQVEVKDLKAAGLNPILSANSGAGASSTPMASLPPIADPINSAQAYRQTEAQIALLKEQARKTNIDGTLAAKSAPLADAQNEILNKIMPKAVSSAKGVIDDAPKAFNDLYDNMTKSSAKAIDTGSSYFQQAVDKLPDWYKNFVLNLSK